jgi:hypothetical protein
MQINFIVISLHQSYVKDSENRNRLQSIRYQNGTVYYVKKQNKKASAISNRYFKKAYQKQFLLPQNSLACELG